MKSIVTLFIGIGLCYTTLSAQYSHETTIRDNITAFSDIDLEFLLKKHATQNRATDTDDGFRIQVFYSNNRNAVYGKKAIVYQNFNSFRAYLVYDQPYYKLRVGDFKTRLEALKHLEALLSFFPEAFIVNDQIKIR